MPKSTLTPEEKIQRRKETTRRYREKNREKVAAAIKKWRTENPHKAREAAKRFASKNPEKVRAIRRKHREANKDKLAKRLKEWRARNKERIRSYKREYERERNKTPEAKIEKSARTALLRAVKGGAMKEKRSIEYFGCTKQFLKDHIARQFKPGMSWENHGLFTWHIDHIRPIAYFDMKDPAQVAEALHYTNLQPLWASENIRKPRSVRTAASNNLGVRI